MKQLLIAVCVVTISVNAFAQDAGSGGVDRIAPLWSTQDATPIPTGQIDLRVGFQWVTAGAPANRGDSDDDFALTPTIVWGTCENVELYIGTTAWLGDGGDVGALEDGNFDTNVGLLWRLSDQDGDMPALAIAGGMRLPTGDGSSGVNGELRLILTNDYDSGIRSHVNVFGASINGDNDETSRYDDHFHLSDLFGGGDHDARDFQWGVSLGLDGPLCDDDAVRWVADYVHRSSRHDGRSNMNLLELGVEWDMPDAGNLGIATQIGLDRTGDTPNFGVGIIYSHTLTN